MIDVLSRAAFTPMPTVPCPDCDRGTTTGPNGESWRCGRCDGRGRIPYAQPMSEQTPTTQPEPEQPELPVEPEPEADPTAPEPGELEPEQPEPEPGDPGAGGVD